MALTRTKRTKAPDTPAAAAPVRLAPAGPVQVQRGIRFPQLLLSLLVVAVFGLLGLWWQASTAARSPVVALAGDVAQGQVLARSDLTTVFVSTDGGIAATTSEQFIDLFVGKVAKADFEFGTLVNGSMFETTSPLAPGEAFVGLELPNNYFPESLAVGDKVDVLLLGGTGGLGQRSFDSVATVESVVANRQGSTRIRIRMDETDAVAVQRAAAKDDVALIEVLAGIAE